jgi:small-conductance mechanosensitive channel|tara:strand:+ start:89 stop:913 length:825 start_codon:yes stop_codon:yes gene_type:complete
MINEFLYKSIKFGTYELSIQEALEVIFAILAGWFVIYATKQALKGIAKKRRIDEGRRFLIFRLARTFIYVITLFIVTDILGFNLTVIWAGSAALLVGVGIGLQSFFNDVISGFVLLFEGGVRVGDELEVGGDLVRVKSIALRATSVETVCGDLVVMPNSKIAGDSVRNLSQGQSTTRISVEVGVAYGSDVKIVSEILFYAMQVQTQVVQSPKPQVIFKSFGDSSLDFEVRGWVKSPWDRKLIESDVRFKIDAAFRESNITIPFPQRDVHVHTNL